MSIFVSTINVIIKYEKIENHFYRDISVKVTLIFIVTKSKIMVIKLYFNMDTKLKQFIICQLLPFKNLISVKSTPWKIH